MLLANSKWISTSFKVSIDLNLNTGSSIKLSVSNQKSHIGTALLAIWCKIHNLSG